MSGPDHFVRLVDGAYANCSKGDPGAMRVTHPVPEGGIRDAGRTTPVRWRCVATLESKWDDDLAPMTLSCEVEAYDEEGAKAAFESNMLELFYGYTEHEGVCALEVEVFPVDPGLDPRSG